MLVWEGGKRGGCTHEAEADGADGAVVDGGHGEDSVEVVW